MEKAITVVENALSDFERRNRMPPRVILLPRRLFRQFEAEQELIAAALGPLRPREDGAHDRQWTDVRVVEHEAIEEIEIY